MYHIGVGHGGRKKINLFFARLLSQFLFVFILFVEIRYYMATIYSGFFVFACYKINL
ncbi:hypothetical protein HMPREF3191_00990 [Veillonellaceae bacterium DNF00626]|nr:hypothetical protein HMPREF3191_00990 [Veillonellaceae bacterium DNF00626]